MIRCLIWSCPMNSMKKEDRLKQERILFSKLSVDQMMLIRSLLLTDSITLSNLSLEHWYPQRLSLILCTSPLTLTSTSYISTHSRDSVTHSLSDQTLGNRILHLLPHSLPQTTHPLSLSRLCHTLSFWTLGNRILHLQPHSLPLTTPPVTLFFVPLTHFH